MLEIYNEGKLVINIDESWIPHTDFRRACWGAKRENNSMPDKVMGHKVNMIVAISSDGKVWLALTQCNTDENVMQLFLSRLSPCLRKSYGNQWKEQIVFLIDGAAYHRSVDTRACLKHLGMNVVISAPYSYSAAAVELWFA